MKRRTIIQFGDKDEVEFRTALLKGGVDRVSAALEGTGASTADASLESDRQLILLEIENSLGLGEFNQMIRMGLLSEYRALAKQGLR